MRDIERFNHERHGVEACREDLSWLPGKRPLGRPRTGWRDYIYHSTVSGMGGSLLHRLWMYPGCPLLEQLPTNLTLHTRLMLNQGETVVMDKWKKFYDTRHASKYKAPFGDVPQLCVIFKAQLVSDGFTRSTKDVGAAQLVSVF